MGKGVSFPISLLLRGVDAGGLAKLREVNARLEQANKPLREATKEFRRFGDESGLGKVSEAFSGLGTSLATAGKRLAMVGGVGLGAAYGLGRLVHAAEQSGSKLKDQAGILGLTVDEYSQLSYAFKRAGVSAEESDGSLEKFNIALSQARRGAGPLAQLLSKVAPEFLKQVKAAKSNTDALDLVSKAMARLDDAGQRGELARAAFGKSGLAMINALKDGPENLQKLRARFLELAGPQGEFAERADAMGDATDDLEASFTGLTNAAAGALFPALTEVSLGVAKVLGGNREGIKKWAEQSGAAISLWVKDGGLERLSKSLGDAATSIGKAIDLVGGMKGVGIALGAWVAAPVVGGLVTLATALIGLGGAMGVTAAGIGAVSLAAAPFLIVGGAIAGLGILIYKNWDSIAGLFKRTGDAISGFVSHPLQSIAQGWKATWDKGDRNSPQWQQEKDDMLSRGFGSPGELAEYAARKAAAPTMPAPPAGQSTAKAQVQVDFANVPPWAKVRPMQDASSILDVSVGRSMAEAY